MNLDPIYGKQENRNWAWKYESNSIATRHLLAHRGMNVQDVCPLCVTQGEIIFHLLRDCPFAQKFWDEIEKTFLYGWELQ